MSIHRMRHESKSNRLLWAVALLLVLGATVGYFKLHPEDIPQWAARTSLGRDPADHDGIQVAGRERCLARGRCAAGVGYRLSVADLYA
ncbi:MAG: hypothetical protein H6962_09345 [Chromatiaceae bacterium]|nr:hypothetical protein [Chromatiaceae bacterium]